MPLFEDTLILHSHSDSLFSFVCFGECPSSLKLQYKDSGEGELIVVPASQGRGALEQQGVARMLRLLNLSRHGSL